ncbi:MAG: FkbM family methyltransferase [Verrucomicrobia bacterium]|nr:FkbM family methyltransferase [Verrucomicrobiota bacterium]
MRPPLHVTDLDAYLIQPSQAEQEFARIFSKDAALVICDIGACEGEDTVRYALRYPLARVFAFEPLPANQQLVRMHLAQYHATNARLIPIALSDRVGEARFHVSSGRPPGKPDDRNWNHGNKSSSLLPPASDGPMHGWIEFKETITVPTGTLDEFCKAEKISHIDFIQMDVQGAERLVLAGATCMLPHITAIWLEVSSKENYRGQSLDRDISGFMAKHGFRLAYRTALGDGSGEGDHLYLNLRQPRVWPYLALRSLRSLAGRVKRATLSSLIPG